MSHMTTFSTVTCLRISLAVDPSPPPIIKTVLGLKGKMKTNSEYFERTTTKKKKKTVSRHKQNLSKFILESYTSDGEEVLGGQGTHGI